MNQHFAQRIAAAYSQHADTYASVLEPSLAPMAAEIARRANLSSGRLALDIATGTGLVARALAHAAASVVGVDISLGILRAASGRSQGQIPFVAGDAHRLPFRARTFDLVTCAISLTHFSDVQTALREVHRLLRPGGRFITSAWATEGENPTKAAAVRVRQRFLPEREITFGGSFGNELWADVARGRAALRRAGFAKIQVATLPLSGAYSNHKEALEAALAWPVTRYRIAQLSPTQQRKLREETAAAIRRVSDLRWRSDLHYYQATRPGD